jgi:hypothetical protein
MRCRLFLLAIAILVGCAALSGVRATDLSFAGSSDYDDLNNAPLLFYLARGGPDACGEGCSEWIAAEGYFDFAAPERLRAVLDKISGRKLPIYFQSPGGYIDQALAIGQMLRERQITAGVAKTIPEACTSNAAPACRAAKRSRAIVSARLIEIDAACNSACVYALIGAPTRLVSAGARLGIHSSKLAGGSRYPANASLARTADKARLASSNAQLRQYIRTMQIDDGLFQAILRVPHERVRVLTRDEIARFGIDARDFQETRWTFIQGQHGSSHDGVFKMFTRASMSGGGGVFRSGLIRLTCAAPSELQVHYALGSASREQELALDGQANVSLVSGTLNLTLPSEGRVPKIKTKEAESSERDHRGAGGIDFFETAATRPVLELIEPDSSSRPAGATRTLKLSTAGLAEATAELRRSCSKTLKPVWSRRAAR